MASKVELNPDEDNFPDKYEILRDENIYLKTQHKQLEEQIKLIAVKLKRQVTQIKQERSGHKTHFSAEFEKDLDKLIEENIRLQEEERVLTDKIKQIQI